MTDKTDNDRVYDIGVSNIIMKFNGLFRVKIII